MHFELYSPIKFYMEKTLKNTFIENYRSPYIIK